MAKRNWKTRFSAAKSGASLLVLFIPSVDRDGEPVDQHYWVGRALESLGTWFGGATAFPQARGVWRDDSWGGRLVFDEPVVIQCYTSEASMVDRVDDLRELLLEMGRQTRQGAVGLVIDREYLEISITATK
ncbi:MAG TPA: hypothetical protein VMP01_20640 [Pirellulaceae bacterium]|nr:hypothetical protein [Pirellulaceae bacterium]